MMLQGKLESVTIEDDQSVLFSVDVKDVVNETALVLPFEGKMVFEQGKIKIDFNYILILEVGGLVLKYLKDGNIARENMCLGILKYVEHTL